MANHSENDLEQLYASRKKRHSAPASIKKQLLLAQQSSSAWHRNFQSFGLIVATSFTLVLFAVVLSYQTMRPVHTNDTVVYLHSLEQPTRISQTTVNSEKYADAYRAYINQEQTFSAHHNQQAKLQLTDQGWQLSSCDNSPLLLSQDLVEALTRLNKIAPNLNQGDTVLVAFAQNGIVLGIENSQHPMRCS